MSKIRAITNVPRSRSSTANSYLTKWPPSLSCLSFHLPTVTTQKAQRCKAASKPCSSSEHTEHLNSCPPQGRNTWGKSLTPPWQLPVPNLGNGFSNLTLSSVRPLYTFPSTSLSWFWEFITPHTAWLLKERVLPAFHGKQVLWKLLNPVKMKQRKENEQNTWFSMTEQLCWAAQPISLSGQKLGTRTEAKPPGTVITCVAQ